MTQERLLFGQNMAFLALIFWHYLNMLLNINCPKMCLLPCHILNMSIGPIGLSSENLNSFVFLELISAICHETFGAR